MNDIVKYLESLPTEHRAIIEKIIKVIKRTTPNAVEVISYGMPVYKYKGKYLIGVAAFKEHMSIFPGSGAVEEFASALTEFKTSKGTIQFTATQPLSESLLVRIINYRRRQIDELKH